jgi:Arc/MetJ-type ribon-helix-helix transcriptional regulator
VEQQAEGRASSKFVGIRLTADDQQNLRAIIEAGFADNISDAIRCALRLAVKAAERIRGDS